MSDVSNEYKVILFRRSEDIWEPIYDSSNLGMGVVDIEINKCDVHVDGILCQDNINIKYISKKEDR